MCQSTTTFKLLYMKSVITIITMPTVINDRVYACVTFTSVEHANKFMADNPEWGVIHEEGGNIHLALITDKGQPVKTRDTADFYQEAGVFYSHDFYKGATMFRFISEYLPKGYTICRAIFGVTEDQGNKLLAHWNKQQPDTWKYSNI